MPYAKQISGRDMTHEEGAIRHTHNITHLLKSHHYLFEHQC